MKCTACGTENNDNAKFCVSCGVVSSKIQQLNTTHCASCSSENYAAALFCSHCGNKLHSQVSEQLPHKKKKAKHSMEKQHQKKNSRLIFRSIAAFVAVTCLIIIMTTKESRMNIRYAPAEAGTFQLDSAVQVIATADHKIQIFSKFFCPCGKCGVKDDLADCHCKHPHGAEEVKSFVDNLIAKHKYTVAQIVDQVDKKYGGRKVKSL